MLGKILDFDFILQVSNDDATFSPAHTGETPTKNAPNYYRVMPRSLLPIQNLGAGVEAYPTRFSRRVRGMDATEPDNQHEPVMHSAPAEQLFQSTNESECNPPADLKPVETSPTSSKNVLLLFCFCCGLACKMV